jgi:electron transport complex protein RnfD
LNQPLEKTEITPTIHVAPSPHVSNMTMTTRGMMLDVLIALVPVVAAAMLFFGLSAAKQLLICVITSMAAEALFTRMRQRPFSLMDLSAVVTGLILGLSLPATAPWYVGCIGAVIAVGIGKIVFGGLGMNIFNPAMVGRAFVMIAFAGSMAASG